MLHVAFKEGMEEGLAANPGSHDIMKISWHDGSLGQITFRDYVEGEWLPHKHLELTTRAAYNSY